MLQVAIEIFGLVLGAALCGYSLGYGSGKLFELASAKPMPSEDEGEPSQPHVEQPITPRRIPDPAPPSGLRRKRFQGEKTQP